MQMTDLIAKKRDGGALSTEEIQFIIRGYTEGSIPDYQMSALCMAILFRGMDDREILDLTMAMVNSGPMPGTAKNVSTSREPPTVSRME